MAHFRKRRPSDQRNATRGRKTYLARGVQRRDYWDNVPSQNTRQRLKRELRTLLVEEWATLQSDKRCP